MLLTKTVKIEVTAEDIRRGVPRTPEACPVALAAQRALGREDIDVGQGSIRLRGGDYWADYERLPEPVAEAILLYDTRLTMAPFTFRLDVPRTWLRRRKL